MLEEPTVIEAATARTKRYNIQPAEPSAVKCSLFQSLALDQLELELAQLFSRQLPPRARQAIPRRLRPVKR